MMSSKWKHFPRYWPFVRGKIHSSPVDSPHKGQWRRALMFSLICAWTNGWANSRDGGDLRRHRAHYDVIVVIWVNYNILPLLLKYCILVVFFLDSLSFFSKLNFFSIHEHFLNVDYLKQYWWVNNLVRLCVDCRVLIKELECGTISTSDEKQCAVLCLELKSSLGTI